MKIDGYQVLCETLASSALKAIKQHPTNYRTAYLSHPGKKNLQKAAKSAFTKRAKKVIDLGSSLSSPAGKRMRRSVDVIDATL